MKRIVEMAFNFFKGTKLGKFPLVARFLPHFQSRVYRVDDQVLKGLIGPDGSFLYYPECYEKDVRHIFCKLLKKEDVVVDVGASIGYYTLLAAKRVSKGLIYSFESNLFRFKGLIENIKANGWENVRAYPIKISDHSTLGTATLDSLLKDADLVKIDVEGKELEVLRGMRGILSKGNAKVICEVHPNLCPTEDILELLKSHEYEIYSIEDKLKVVDSFEEERKHYLFVQA